MMIVCVDYLKELERCRRVDKCYTGEKNDKETGGGLYNEDIKD